MSPSAGASYWDKLFAVFTREDMRCDFWLQQFDEIVQQCQTPIIDLGCGRGQDSLYLVERGKRVIACDYSQNAIRQLRQHIDLEQALCFDMADGLPFEDSFTDLILSDLSLHYFSEQTTRFILGEIKRVLKPDGILLLRVNSTEDVNYGAGQGTEIERNYYRTDDGRFKRFFDADDIFRFFGDWEILHQAREQSTRYGAPKELWTLCLKPK